MKKEQIIELLNECSTSDTLYKLLDEDVSATLQLKSIFAEFVKEAHPDIDNISDIVGVMLNNLTWQQFYNVPTYTADEISNLNYATCITEDFLNDLEFSNLSTLESIWEDLTDKEEISDNIFSTDIFDVFENNEKILIESTDESERKYDKAFYNDTFNVIVSYHFQD